MSSLSATKVSSWAAACATVIANANITTGYVGQFGNPMPEFTNYTWGIDSKTCYEYCGKGNIYEVGFPTRGHLHRTHSSLSFLALIFT